MTVYIYALYEQGLPDRVYRYVGRTRYPELRLSQHRIQVNKDLPVAAWIRDVHKRGGEIGLEVIEELVDTTKAAASAAERNWVMALGAEATNKLMRWKKRVYKTFRRKLSPQTAEETPADAENQNQTNNKPQ